MKQEFKLHYWISNNGDGSASTRFVGTKKEAEKADENQQENGEGWGEPCNSNVSLKYEDGKLFVESRDDNWKQIWVEVPMKKTKKAKK